MNYTDVAKVITGNREDDDDVRDACDGIALDLADLFRHNNPSGFDRERFLREAGYRPRPPIGKG